MTDDPASAARSAPGRSCLACRKRKIRCDRGQPCRYCTRLRVECVYSDPSASKGQEKKNQPENDVVSRLERIEAALLRLESRVTGVQSNSPSSQPPPPEVSARSSVVARAESEEQRVVVETTGPPTADSTNGRLIQGGERDNARFVTGSFWADLDDEADKDGLAEVGYQPSQTQQPSAVAPVSSQTSNNQPGRLDPGFVFGLRPSSSSDLLELHPSSESRIFVLWQVFLESVDPLLKIIHVPTTQRQILRATQNLAQIPPSFEALLFSIYFAAVTSMQCSVSCKTLLHEERQALLSRYGSGVERALAKAQFMSAPDMPSLQALTLYLTCARQSADKAYIWSMTGLLIRLATKLGLHRDPVAALGLSPFVAEMRRRLWWQICVLDVRTAEDNDMEPLIYEHSFDTKLPANVNDTDLDVNMTHPVPETQNRTEMMYPLVRIEISYAMRKVVFSSKFNADNGYPILSPSQKNDMIDSVARDLQERYLKFGDPNIPICFLADISSRMVLDKVRLTVNHPARRGGDDATGGRRMGGHRRLVDLVGSSIEMIECAHTMRTNARFSRWVWLFQKYVEWDAVAFLLHSLGSAGAAPLPATSTRAWKANDTFFRDWTGHVPPGEERRWRRLERLREKALAEQGGPGRSSADEILDNNNAVTSVTDHQQGSNEFHSAQSDKMQQQTGGPAEQPSGRRHDEDPLSAANNPSNVSYDGGYVDWDFGNVPYASQGVPSWEMDVDEIDFNSWT